jgi:DNA adenine methylase
LTPNRPIVRYHGGKWRLAPWIISYFPAHRIYVEPFGGGGSVLLRKPRSYAEVYNDLDGEIVNLFRAARDHGEQLRRLIELTPFSREEFDASYEPSEDPLEQARRTMIRCGMGFGSSAMNTDSKTGFRGSATRSGTHPATDWSRLGENLAAVISRLQGVIIENRDALEIIAYHDSPATLHYIDPPYLRETRTWKGGHGSYRHEMTDADHEQLAAVLREVKGAVIVSGYPSSLYEDLYAGWTRAERASLADGAAPRTEVLWMKGIDLGLFAEKEEA